MENDNKKKKINVGKDSVVIGNVSGNIGDGSVVIGPTDSHGNVILNQSMAVGRNAFLGPGSIAIGANAGAGSGAEISGILRTIETIIQEKNDVELLDKFQDFIIELNKPQKNKSLISDLWDVIKTSATLNGAISLTQKISVLIEDIVS
jgi:NDP-sugar pyrophosphorylase family protein